MQETRFDPWVSKIPWRREWQPIPVFLPRESHGQRSLACCSPWGRKESDATEQLNWTDWTADGVIRKRGELANSNGEGNGTSLQYSCLESPVDRGAWWAAVHGVAESDTTEWLHFHFSFSCIGEGNGNPLQCSCLENPRDRGAWWAAVYGVSPSRTRQAT